LAASSRRASEFERGARALLTSLRRRRTLRPGSLIITIFGDAIAPRGGVVALASLIRAGALFGVTERHVRTSVGRLAQEGWIEAQRSGRVSFYRLSDVGRRRFAEATHRIYGESPTEWSGSWTLVALLPGMSADRERIRSEMTLLGFGQLQPGLLASPTHAPDDTLATLKELGALPDVLVSQARVIGGIPDERIARSAWNLDELERRYQEFIDMFAPLARHAGSAAMSNQSAFVVRTLLIHEYRRVHLRDPLLPVSMLPREWAGRRAAELCRSLYATLFQRAERYLSESMRSAAGDLPPPSAETYRRFGGLRP
jgi:phenylacetic acid degradation operon negative regulatory protein